MSRKFSATSKLRKKNHWSARLIVFLIGAAMATWGWLLVHRGVDAYPTTNRFGGPSVAYSRTWIGFGLVFVVVALVPWDRIFGRGGKK